MILHEGFPMRFHCALSWDQWSDQHNYQYNQIAKLHGKSIRSQHSECLMHQIIKSKTNYDFYYFCFRNFSLNLWKWCFLHYLFVANKLAFHQRATSTNKRIKVVRVSATTTTSSSSFFSRVNKPRNDCPWRANDHFLLLSMELLLLLFFFSSLISYPNAYFSTFYALGALL